MRELLVELLLVVVLSAVAVGLLAATYGVIS